MKKIKSNINVIIFSLLLIFLFESGTTFAKTVVEDTANIHKQLDKAISLNITNPDSVLLCLKDSFLLAKETPNDDLKTRMFLKYANSLYGYKEFDSLENLMLQERKRIVESGDSLVIAEVNLLYGSTLRQLSRLDEAKEYLFESIEFSGELKNSVVGNAYVRLGLVNRSLADYEPAIDSYLNAIKIFEHLHDSNGLVKSYGNLANMYFDLKEYKNSEIYCLKALEILKHYNNIYFEATICNRTGAVYQVLKQYDKSLEYYQKAYAIADEINASVFKGNTKLNMGNLFESLGQIDKALENYEEALLINKQCDNFAGEVVTRAAIADLYCVNNMNIKIALKHIDTSLQIAMENDMLYRLPMIYHIKADLYYKLGKYRQAYDTLVKRNVLKDSVFNLGKSKQINELQLKYETEKKETQILALENEALQKDLEIKRKNNQKNLITGSGLGLIVILSLLFILHFQKTRKNRLINEKEILRLKEEKKALAAKSIVEGQEEERKRVARELHDGIGVLLSNVKMQFSSFMDKSPENKEMLDKAASVLNQASVDVRRISHNMMPGNLNKFGLIAAIEDLFEDISESGVIKAEVSTDLSEDRFHENKEIMLYRIVQELVNNTIKHAQATNISLNINKVDHKVLVNYADNGSGFDPKKKNVEKSMGLKSVDDRVNFLGGELSIESASGKGASFSFDFPL